MSSLIKIKRSAVSGKKPQLADLQVGELALNTYDGSLFIKRDTGGVGIATTVSNLSPWTESFGASSISYVSGNVGVCTDVFTDPVRIANDKKLAVGVATAYALSSVNSISTPAPAAFEPDNFKVQFLRFNLSFILALSADNT